MTTTAENPTAGTTRINPTTWSQYFRYDQAQLRPAPSTLLSLAGQGPIDADGALQHVGDVAAQLALTLDNVEQLLAEGRMGWNDVLRMTIYVTDMDAALASYPVITERLDVVGANPPATLVGVQRLAIPGMDVEIEVTAGV